jgi:hypothetical protein
MTIVHAPSLKPNYTVALAIQASMEIPKVLWCCLAADGHYLVLLAKFCPSEEGCLPIESFQLLLAIRQGCKISLNNVP